MASARDVTERVEAENLRRVQQEWFEALVSNGFDSVSVFDADGTIIYIQPIVGGYSHDKMIGRPKSDWVHPDDVGKWDDTLAQLVQQGEGATAEITYRARFPRGTSGGRHDSPTCSIIRQ